MLKTEEKFSAFLFQVALEILFAKFSAIFSKLIILDLNKTSEMSL
jgi:hypothetical protein